MRRSSSAARAGTFFWRRLDRPGHDGCRLLALANGWRLSGAAVFFEGKPCHFSYEVTTDAAWRSRGARVTGYLGTRAVDLRIRAAGSGRWEVDGVQKKAVAGCIDLDLSFTPATNLIVLRRLALEVGERAEAPAAYLEFPGLRLVRLPQSYARISRSEYAYEAPTIGYAATLRVQPSGAIAHYPGLFEQMTSG